MLFYAIVKEMKLDNRSYKDDYNVLNIGYRVDDFNMEFGESATVIANEEHYLKMLYDIRYTCCMYVYNQIGEIACITALVVKDDKKVWFEVFKSEAWQEMPK